MGLERSGFWRIAGLSREDEIRRALPEIVLTPEQAAEAEQIEDILWAKSRATVRYLVPLLRARGTVSCLGRRSS